MMLLRRSIQAAVAAARACTLLVMQTSWLSRTRGLLPVVQAGIIQLGLPTSVLLEVRARVGPQVVPAQVEAKEPARKAVSGSLAKISQSSMMVRSQAVLAVLEVRAPGLETMP
ncbi:hypothetical protein IL59_0216715 [Brucella suis bv. 4 str. 40]|nr:hypothetical protein IL59_0216715 [Brucella suis bv. 4 str. 40]